ncbi:UxaA family hydrolase [Aquabacter spiritensis]|uniref:Altronate hydrolase n=1 Tax=Aquabacter spiritensis TaxID=933073 RepID=A0A4R3LV36_9HYPH|nr:altronate dehydratase family protein [Aquabacter spiritensis]TCT03896.1 altronate hydrolase [Aquabacter spiritensis]
MPDPATAPRTLRLSPRDNVAVALDTLPEGSRVDGLVIPARVPRGHKFALAEIADGAPILKFGQIIGFAAGAIAPGAHIHVHNVALHDFDRDYAFAADARAEVPLPPEAQGTFAGFRRSNGRTGTRNYLGILTSVNCSASVARFAAEHLQRAGVGEWFPGVDGIVPITHGTGCGMAAKGEGFEVLSRTLWGYATHPNFAAVVMVGLGCEMFQIARFKAEYGVEETDTFRTLTIQDEGGTRRAVEHITGALREMLPAANALKRSQRPLSELVLALQCGGSDGYSGLTANPALGVASDLLVRHGGTSILSETPEIYGAEHLLTRRAATRAVGEKLVARIRWWEAYTARNGGEMNNNPSPGNKAGGLTTILEKSLGAAAKGGSSTLNAVYEYAEPVTAPGFVFMDTPGYDPVAATGQVAGGANLICFTTGRGSAFGCKPTPSIKLATNTDVYQRMTEDMDINCGDVLDGVPLERKGEEIFDLLVRVASGERTKSELLGYGDAEFVPWQIGAVM